MTRLRTVEPAQATGEVADLLAQVQQTFGATPNMTKAMATSPAMLRGYLAFLGALSGGELPVALRELIALGVAEANNCDYCLSAHTYLATNVAKLAEDQVEAGRRLRSPDSSMDAALRFVQEIHQTQGAVSDQALVEVRAAGYGDGAIAELVANVALNVLTNYFNKVAGTQIDFPVVRPLATA